MTTRTAKRKQFLLDVFTTAIEGGIGYWSTTHAYHWALEDESDDLDGFYATIVDIESEAPPGEDDGTGVPKPPAYRIDIDVIAKGFARFFQWVVDRGFAKDHYYWQAIEANRTNGDDGDFDATVADIIVQLGLFNEIVYG